jgi:anti-sigma regulatory factor (Ser/Thr protein kinase)
VAVVALEIPARPAYLSLVRLVVDAAVQSLAPGLGGARLDDLKLAVTEACSNAIEAHQTAWSDSPILVRCELDDKTVSVEVADRGGGFDPHRLAVLPAATDPLRLRYESGLGIPLMRTLSDDLAFLARPDGTTVRLTVYRAKTT